MEKIKQNAIQNLEDIKKIFDNLNINFFLDGGTLLGAYRDNDFPEGDEDDIDLGCIYYSIEEKIDRIISEAEKLGFSLYHQWKYQLAFKRGGSKIDIFFHRRFNDQYVSFLYKRVRDVDGCGIYEKDENGNLFLCIPMVVPFKYYSGEINIIKFYGMDLNIPFLVEDYLKFKYGDWKTPIHRKDYANAGGCYNPEMNKVVNINFLY
jgi:hypothetical protein